MNSRSLSIVYFLIGLGTATKVHLIGFIGISQIVLFAITPFLFMKSYSEMRRDGFMTFVNLSILCFIGCIISSVYNQTQISLALRGLALVYTRIVSVVVFYYLMKRDLAGLKWFFVGLAISQVVTIWGFREGNEAFAQMKVGEAFLQNRELFFMQHFGGLFTIPMYAFYLQTPVLISLGLCCLPGIRTFLVSSTGRGSVLLLAMTIGMTLFAGRSVRRMQKVKRYFILLMSSVLLGGLAFASLYKYLGQAGMLNEEAQVKYERQMRNANAGIIGKIMAGRAEFFIALFAIADSPIFGFGPWPEDKNDYTMQFLAKYGAWEDVQKWAELEHYRASLGLPRNIPLHSEICSSWVYNSILGLPVYLYLLWLILRVVRHHLSAVPQWYGYYAMYIPGVLWGIFFSPPGSSIDPFVAMLLFSVAIGRGKIKLPKKMYIEVMRHAK